MKQNKTKAEMVLREKWLLVTHRKLVHSVQDIADVPFLYLRTPIMAAVHSESPNPSIKTTLN